MFRLGVESIQKVSQDTVSVTGHHLVRQTNQGCAVLYFSAADRNPQYAAMGSKNCGAAVQCFKAFMCTNAFNEYSTTFFTFTLLRCYIPLNLKRKNICFSKNLLC